MAILRVIPGGFRLSLRVQPRAPRSAVAGVHGDALKVRLAAQPVDGAANRELIRFLADLLQVPRSDVRLLSGLSTRNKVVEVRGVDAARARARLGLDR